jgi:hypothetical protein
MYSQYSYKEPIQEAQIVEEQLPVISHTLVPNAEQIQKNAKRYVNFAIAGAIVGFAYAAFTNKTRFFYAATGLAAALVVAKYTKEK